jgi:hypothetical protein
LLFLLGKFYQVILVQELLRPCRMEQKRLIPSLMCYWPSSCLLLECFSNMGARYVRMYVLLLSFFFFFFIIISFGTSIFHWISCFVLFLSFFQYLEHGGHDHELSKNLLVDWSSWWINTELWVLKKSTSDFVKEGGNCCLRIL